MNKEVNALNIELISTKDGSYSLVNKLLDETYHSRHGAVQESLHVFINNGLLFWQQQHPHQPVSIFEVGMGTGLNVLLTLQQALASDNMFYYTTLEPFPVPAEIVSQLNYFEFVKDEQLEPLFEKIHACSWKEEVHLQNNFVFRKLRTTLQEVILSPAAFDIIYFDAFAANKQPEMWTYAMLEKVISLLKPDGVWVTYAAKGQMKRDLKSLELEVETLPGPPGKAEMVRAIKL